MRKCHLHCSPRHSADAKEERDEERDAGKEEKLEAIEGAGEGCLGDDDGSML